mgnify:CR=1 FL=1
MQPLFSLDYDEKCTPPQPLSCRRRRVTLFADAIALGAAHAHPAVHRAEEPVHVLGAKVATPCFEGPRSRRQGSSNPFSRAARQLLCRHGTTPCATCSTGCSSCRSSSSAPSSCSTWSKGEFEAGTSSSRDDSGSCFTEVLIESKCSEKFSSFACWA